VGEGIWLRRGESGWGGEGRREGKEGGLTRGVMMGTVGCKVYYEEAVF